MYSALGVGFFKKINYPCRMKMLNQYNIITAKQNPELVNRTQERIDTEWPEFMLHDPVANLFCDCYEKLPQFQFVLEDNQTGDICAIANSIPLYWDEAFEDLPDKGWDWAMLTGIEQLKNKIQPNILCALQVVVFSGFKGRGISSQAVLAMKSIGKSYDLSDLIAPVRPTLKCNYPLIPIHNYIKWQNSANKPYDPWIRVHNNLGAKIIKPCLNSMRITGTVSDWKKWTKLDFLESGEYIIPGALNPVVVDIDKNIGTYIEPNVWLHHKL